MGKKVVSITDSACKHPRVLRERELGNKRRIGYEDELSKKLMTSLEWFGTSKTVDHGGIFNLDFSHNGSILAASCEKKSILLYDALNRKQIGAIPDAHDNCVNCITFLDQFAFASGSDDNTVKTWDLRSLKSPSLTLRGHSNWVKNIEYSTKNKRLITSAFDGGIYSWDLNNYTEQSVVYDRLFVLDGLMRMKLTPGGNKLIMCTSHGYMLIIHDVELETLNIDLQRFKPNIYRLMQESEQDIPIASCSNKLFSPHRKANRVELISDFPNTAELISSLQIHPMGWCALTRNINVDELSEWTCVHDIQERNVEDYLTSYITVKLPERSAQYQNQPETPESRTIPMDLWMGYVTNHNLRAQRMIPSSNRQSGIQSTRTSFAVFNSGILSPQPRQELNEPKEEGVEEGYGKIIQNLPRLTHFMEEPNAGKGFIKEVSFSPDGRVICSPFNAGIRLFSFNDSCNELSVCVPEHPQRLLEVAHFKDYHPGIVVSCKFNPVHCLLVSGCLDGHIEWYQPLL